MRNSPQIWSTFHLTYLKRYFARKLTSKYFPSTVQNLTTENWITNEWLKIISLCSIFGWYSLNLLWFRWINNITFLTAFFCYWQYKPFPAERLTKNLSYSKFSNKYTLIMYIPKTINKSNLFMKNVLFLIVIILFNVKFKILWFFCGLT